MSIKPEVFTECYGNYQLKVSILRSSDLVFSVRRSITLRDSQGKRSRVEEIDGGHRGSILTDQHRVELMRVLKASRTPPDSPCGNYQTLFYRLIEEGLTLIKMEQMAKLRRFCDSM